MPASFARKMPSYKSLAAAMIVAGAACAFFGASAEPAFALCKYGTPHCVNPNPGPKVNGPNGNKLPDGPPGATVDCEQFGDCNGVTGADGGPMFPAARRAPTSPKQQPVTVGQSIQ